VVLVGCLGSGLLGVGFVVCLEGLVGLLCALRAWLRILSFTFFPWGVMSVCSTDSV